MQGEVQLCGFRKSGGKCMCQGTELWALPGAPGALSLVFVTELWLLFSREAAAVRMDGVFGSTCSYCGIQTVSLAGWVPLTLSEHSHKQNDDDGKTKDGKCSCWEFLGLHEGNGESPRELRGEQIPDKENQSRQKY